MKTVAFVLAVILPLTAYAATPDGKDIVEHGNNSGALPCAACHGENGQGNTSIGAPALAGLPATTIEAELANLAKGEGSNATMQYIAQSLSPADSKAVAEYFSGLKK